MLRTHLVLLCSMALLACAHAVPNPAPSSPPASSEKAVAPELFDMRVSFWVNLHQELYFRSQPGPGPKPAAAPDADWTPEERAACESAAGVYASHFEGGMRDLLHDTALIGLRQALDGVPDDGSPRQAQIDPAIADALERCAPAYRAHLWPEVSREAHAWIDAAKPLVAAHGKAIVAELTRVYGVAWPSKPLVVQVSHRASRFGAYTLLDPTTITISSNPRLNGGDTALETLFHEASHAMMKSVGAAFAAAFERSNKPEPIGLWHGLLFFTTGEIVRRQMPPGYVTYAEAKGLYARDPAWAALRPILEREWLPYLDGKTSMEAALQRVVAAYPDVLDRVPPPPR